MEMKCRSWLNVEDDLIYASYIQSLISMLSNNKQAKSLR